MPQGGLEALEKEKGNPGEIFVNINLNTDDAFFRESVQR